MDAFDRFSAQFDKVVLLEICGDAEAYVFDFRTLSPVSRAHLVATHLDAFGANLRKQGNAAWEQTYVPFALLGRSLPREVRSRIDLSADHEGVLLFDVARERIMYCAAADDHRGYVAYASLDEWKPRPSFLEESIPATGVAFEGTPTKRTGFTIDQFKIGRGAALMLSIVRRPGIWGFFERLSG